MATKKITDLAALSIPATGDYLQIVDISDLTMAATGTNKKITFSNLLNGAALTPISIAVNGGSVLSYLDSGIYTPVLTNGTNVTASTAFSCQWLRVGNVVTVSGAFNLDPVATGATAFTMSLPYASTLAIAANVGGTAISQGVAQYGSILAGTGSGTASFNIIATDTANQAWAFHFTYRVI